MPRPQRRGVLLPGPSSGIPTNSRSLRLPTKASIASRARRIIGMESMSDRRRSINWRSASYLEIEGLRQPPQGRSIPMTDEAMSPLRRSMIEDMTIRKFAPKSQHDDVQRVKNFAAFLGRSPDTASFEDVRRYCIWRRAALACRPSIRPSRRCGSFLRSRSGATISSSTPMSFTSRQRSELFLILSQRCWTP